MEDYQYMLLISFRWPWEGWNTGVTYDLLSMQLSNSIAGKFRKQDILSCTVELSCLFGFAMNGSEEELVVGLRHVEEGGLCCGAAAGRFGGS